MDRRSFLALIVAGCADPSLEPSLGVGAPAPQPASWTPAVPAVPAPSASLTTSGDPNFDAWLAGFYNRARDAGVPAAVLDRELAGLTPDPRASAQDSRQPEFSKPVSDYVKGVVSDARVVQGRQFRDSLPYLGTIESRYGAPREIVLAIWALESAFGKIQGDMDVIRSLATLAADGRRRAWAEGELIAALKIVGLGEATRTRLKGSWAGAMGQTQFLPSVFLATAVDGDNDGVRDIWGSTADALFSTGAYMAKAGWKRGESWAREVTLPAGFDYSVVETLKQPPAAWGALGVRRADGLPWSNADQAAQAGLILPSGAGGPAFLTFPNHMAIRRYNNSTAYALGVGLLADRFAGEGALVTPWPYETPLSLADRMAAQAALTQLGFNPGPSDGVIGSGTRTALRAWQKARGLPADGYLSVDMVRRLRVETQLP
ncbi:MAG: lytic murein transglycosylase [Caulobacter sp.]|nr:lytic murein transglycosylase [Caulobacter sp.]